MTYRPRIQPPKMKTRAAQLLLFLALVATAFLFNGCSSLESDNASVRPWNSPQGWEGGALGGLDSQQHR